MQAEQSLREGQLEQSLESLQDQVRKDPSNVRHRVFLFQLLCVLGQWDRALTQLNVAAELDAGTLAMAQTYREALRCEVLRADIFAGKRSPLIFGDPQEWVALLVQAMSLVGVGKYAESQALREQAFETAPASAGVINTGTIDKQAFAWIADADSRLGPVLEVVINGRYYWVPFEHIESIVMEEPEDLRDCVWMPAHFTWRNGGQCVGLIPARYPGSESSSDDAVRMGRKTEWEPHPGDVYAGMGQRLLATDVEEYALMDVRSVSFDTDSSDG